MHAGSLGLSVALHVLLVGALALPLARGGSSKPMPPLPPETKMVLVEIAKLQQQQAAAPKPAQGTIAYPKKKKKPEPRPKPKEAAKPKPQQVAVKPTPRPTPTPDPLAAKLAELRKHPYFKDWPEEKLRNLQLPPGMTSWDELAKVTGQLDELDWKGAPPDLGQKQASAGQGGGFGLPGLFGSNEGFGYAARTQTPDGRWQLAFQQMDTMFVARWSEGDAAARVFYYPFGGKEDPARAFDIAVATDDAEMVASMNINHQLIMMGQPPMPAPSANLTQQPQ